MKTIALIIPYFGKFRDDFYFWLKSAEYNSTIDFYIFTDQKIISAPPNNVKVIPSTLHEIELRAKKYVWEGCILEKAYKLCDYRPAYGEMFQDYLKGYDFWGHCDVDLIFGDIRKYITDERLEKYNRLGINGHLTLYRNNVWVNKMFREVDDITVIYSTEKSFIFDEYGIDNRGTSIYWQKKYTDKVYNKVDFDDIEPYKYSLCSIRAEREDTGLHHQFYGFDKGILYRYGIVGSKIEKKESLYVHLQKRRVKVTIPVSNQFLIIPPGKYVS